MGEDSWRGQNWRILGRFRLDIYGKVIYNQSSEALAWVTQRGGTCSHPWRHSGQAGGAVSTWWSCRCPCSQQGSWTRWPLNVSSNSKDPMILYTTWYIHTDTITRLSSWQKRKHETSMSEKIQESSSCNFWKKHDVVLRGPLSPFTKIPPSHYPLSQADPTELCMVSFAPACGHRREKCLCILFPVENFSNSTSVTQLL